MQEKRITSPSKQEDKIIQKIERIISVEEFSNCSYLTDSLLQQNEHQKENHRNIQQVHCGR